MAHSCLCVLLCAQAATGPAAGGLSAVGCKDKWAREPSCPGNWSALPAGEHLDALCMKAWQHGEERQLSSLAGQEGLLLLPGCFNEHQQQRQLSWAITHPLLQQATTRPSLHLLLLLVPSMGLHGTHLQRPFFSTLGQQPRATASHFRHYTLQRQAGQSAHTFNNSRGSNSSSI